MFLETHFRDAFIFVDKLNNDIHRSLVFNELMKPHSNSKRKGKNERKDKHCNLFHSPKTALLRTSYFDFLMQYFYGNIKQT